jgi:hypothetical protein
MPQAAPVLVISGMHRSGTSLLAGLAAAAGIDMGAELLPGSKGNRRGHFEDAELVRFHEGCLARRGAGPLRPPAEGVTAASAEEERQARQILARRAGKPAWGFKDPRAALFLPLWERLLAAPFFLLLYRHPVEVALSLLRRGIDLEVQLDPQTAIDAWTVYNRRILAFRRASPERCLLLSVAGARRDLPAALALAAARSGLPLGRGVERLYAPDELRTGLAARTIDWPAILPAAMEIHRLLEEAADLPGGEADPLGDLAVTPRERELQEAGEHLLAAALAARAGAPPAAAVSLGERSRYSELRLVIARQDGHLRELRGRIGELSEEIAALGREHERLEATRVLRLARAYWGAARRLRGWRRQAAWRARRLAGGAPPPPAAEIVVGCVAEDEPALLAQALRLVRSLRWFGGSLAAARMLVCVAGGIAPAARAQLEGAGAEVRAVEPFDHLSSKANKLQFFAEALATGARGLLLLDCDTAVVRDPWPLLAGGALQAKIADVPSVPHDVFARLFRRYRLPLPRRRYRTTLLPERTILYCNSGVLFLTSEVARELVPVWRDWNRRLLDAPELLGPCAHHANQASLTLALAAHPIPFAEAPAALNFPLHMNHLPRPPAVAAADPAILHYHGEVDAHGLLLPAASPRAQARIEALNARLAGLEEEGPQGAATSTR